jgi:hypothetical protein
MAGVVELLPGLSAGGEVIADFSLIGSLEPAVLESAVLASAFCGVGAESRSGLAVIGFAARLSSSSVGFGPQHRNDRNLGGPFLFGCSVNVLGEPLSGVVGCFFSVMVLDSRGKSLLLAVLLDFLLPVKLRLELFEPSVMLCDEP